jgi:UDP:flavonoid glycosyltransferase YjiC (YdhE family)
MAHPPHLLVALSDHGYGHITQTAPVINRLRALRPSLRLSIASRAPRALLQERFDGDWQRVSLANDSGMVMTSAFDVQRTASADAYRELHAGWQHAVEHTAQALRALRPDLLLANVSYLPLAAAAHAGIPALAMSSLNWADMYRHFCGARPEAAAIHTQILAAYNSAACFLRLEPGMPMDNLVRRRSIGPVARIGETRRAHLRQRLRLDAATRLVLVTLGGIATRMDIRHWPRVSGVHWLLPAAWQPDRADTTGIESLAIPFADLICSCDALIGKPGYGSISEAACNATPMLYVKRGDWPEEPYLVDWLEQHSRCGELGRDEFERGQLAGALERLWAAAERPRIEPTGVTDAANYLAQEWF